jgi:3-hydroxyacyl-[acyl-carrier-protein] dehydratase
VKVNAEHAIFKGHFPQQPIVPGVCMMQLIKEILENGTHETLMLTSADYLKFMTMWTPDQHPELNAEIKIESVDNDYKVIASLQQGETVFFKMKGVFRKISNRQMQ